MPKAVLLCLTNLTKKLYRNFLKMATAYQQNNLSNVVPKTTKTSPKNDHF